MANYNSQLQSNNVDLQTVLQTLQTKASGGGGEQATPEISVNSATGLITATAGTKTSTHQLAFQPAKTITPTATSQVAVPGGYYTGGEVTVAGDSNLVASNIKSGVSIFGVSGTLVEDNGESSGEAAEWSENEDAMVMGTLSNYVNDRVGLVRSGAFHNCGNLKTVSFPSAIRINANAFVLCTSLTTVSFPVVTTIDFNAFQYCYSLKTVSFPAATFIAEGVFSTCSNLTTVSFPVATTIGSSAFYGCSRLTTVSFPAVTTIRRYAFQNCSRLTTLYLTGSSLCALSNSNAFSNAGIKSNAGSIYVPASLLTVYQTATNWTYFSTQFVGV